MTYPSRFLAAALMLTLILGSFGAGQLSARADDTATTPDASATTVSATGSTADGTAATSVTAASDSLASQAGTSNTPSTADSSGTALQQSGAPAAVPGDTATSTEPSDSKQPQSASTTPSVPLSTTGSASTTLPVINSVLTGTSTASSTSATDTASSSFPIPTVSTSTTATTTGPTILSGEAVTLANILNIVNTNLVNSTGNVLLLNYTTPVTDAVDLRSGTPALAATTSCALIACAGTGGVSVNLASNADLKNAVVLSATSGGNLIDIGSTTEASSSTATILTGDALAGLNLINLANLNIINSNYLLVAMNAFKGVTGDIIFPSLTNFLSMLANNLSIGSASITNEGNITNNVTANANAGGNDVENASSSMVSTGTANSTASVFNQMNTTMFGGSNVAILFRLQGNWTGQVYGAPTGLIWTKGADGSLAFFVDPSSASNASRDPMDASLMQLTASSTAHITNDVNVEALTGSNTIKNAAAALIRTGDALASANVLNIANTNIVGKNWIMAVVNIFGDFTGNISFGRPDLWVGEQATVPSMVQNGSVVTYTVTIMNKGDAPASDVKLTNTYDQAHLQLSAPSRPFTNKDGSNLSWSLGTIPPGGAVTLTYQGTVQDAQPGTVIANTAKAAAHEPDNNPADNTDATSFTASGAAPHTDSGYFVLLNAINSPLRTTATTTPVTAHVTVTRDVTKATSDGSPVHQSITIANDSRAASIPLIAHDILIAPDGTQVYDETWDIGSLAAGDAVQLEYDASFSANAPAGTYTLSTVLADEEGKVLGRFSGNGMIQLIPARKIQSNTLKSAGPHFAKPTHTTQHSVAAPVVADRNHGSVLGAVFPGVAVAHADTGNQAASTGLLPFSWPYILGSIAVLLGVLTLLAWYRKSSSD